MAECKTIGFRLGKKDKDLKSWFLAIKKRELEHSFYVKKAIEAYLNNQKILLGRVRCIEDDEPYVTSISVYQNDKHVLDLINMLKTNNIKLSSFIKHILRQYIEVVPDTEKEYIPDYYNLNDINKFFKPNIKPLENNKENSKENVKENSSKSNVIDIIINNNTEKNNANNSIKEDKKRFATKFVTMGK